MTTKQNLGLTFRLVGPFLEGVALVVILLWGRQGRTFLGVSVEAYCYATLAVGLVLAIIGLTLRLVPDKRDRQEI